MELSTFIVVYVLIGIVVGICVLGMTSEYIEESRRPNMPAPIWVIGAIFCGIVWPLTCVILLGEYFYILINRRI